MRLALKLGIVDVDALHDSLTREQIDQWKSLAIVDGWYHGRAQEAEMLAAIHNAINRLIVFNASEPEQANRNLDWKSGSEILKEFTKFGRTKKRTERSVAEWRKHLEKTHGN